MGEGERLFKKQQFSRALRKIQNRILARAWAPWYELWYTRHLAWAHCTEMSLEKAFRCWRGVARIRRERRARRAGPLGAVQHALLQPATLGASACVVAGGVGGLLAYSGQGSALLQQAREAALRVLDRRT
jgi:hypothetical protein